MAKRVRWLGTDDRKRPSCGEDDPLDKLRGLVAHDEQEERLDCQGKVPERRARHAELRKEGCHTGEYDDDT